MKFKGRQWLYFGSISEWVLFCNRRNLITTEYKILFNECTENYKINTMTKNTLIRNKLMGYFDIINRSSSLHQDRIMNFLQTEFPI